jgi:hypothetical protein
MSKFIKINKDTYVVLSEIEAIKVNEKNITVYTHDREFTSDIPFQTLIGLIDLKSVDLTKQYVAV